MKDPESADELMDVLLGSTTGPFAEEIDQMAKRLTLDPPEDELERAVRAVQARTRPRSMARWALAAAAVLALSAFAAWTLAPEPLPADPQQLAPAPEDATEGSAPSEEAPAEDLQISIEHQTRLCNAAHRAYREQPGNEALYIEVRDCYQRYFERFSGTPEEHVQRYAYAEFLYTAGEFEAAYDAYERCVVSDPKGKHALFCAKSRLFAAQKVNDATPGHNLWDEKLVEAADALIEGWPDDEATPTARYQAAYSLYEDQEYEAARTRFLTVVEADPDAARRAMAAQLVVDTFAVSGDYSGLATALDGFLDQQDRFEETTLEEFRAIRSRLPD